MNLIIFIASTCIFFFFNKSLYNEGNIKKKSSFDELSIINYYFWNNLEIDWNFERD